MSVFCNFLVAYKTYSFYKLLWRNWLARSTVNRKVGGSSPPGSVS